MASKEELLALAAKVRSRVQIAEGTGCWEWPGAKNSGGYGQVWSSATKRLILTHRVMVLAGGREIADKMEVDHLCRNRRCCNPDHLEVVTSRENTIRGMAGEHRKRQSRTITHCPRGHPYNDENTHVSKRGRRHCKRCARARCAASRAKMRQAGLTIAGAGRLRIISRTAKSAQELQRESEAFYGQG